MTLVIAHRGASRAYPENTVAAFRGAVELGADGVELDVRRTRDGQLVVVHDPSDQHGRVVAQTERSDLAPEIPTLDEALDACGALMVNIEVKNLPSDPDYDASCDVAAAVVALVRSRRASAPSAPETLVSSFNLDDLDRARSLPSAPPVAWLLFVVPDPVAALDRAVAHHCAAVHPHHGMVDEPFVAMAHARGLAVNPWTVDEPERLRALVAMGVDGIITNVPDVARTIVG